MPNFVYAIIYYITRVPFYFIVTKHMPRTAAKRATTKTKTTAPAPTAPVGHQVRDAASDTNDENVRVILNSVGSVPTKLAAFVRSCIKLKAQGMGIVLRDVPIDALSMYSQNYVTRMAPRSSTLKYRRAHEQAQALAVAAGYDDLLDAVKDTCDSHVVAPTYLDWMAKDARGMSRPANMVLAFKQEYNPSLRAYAPVLLGVAFYGKFEGIEPAEVGTGAAPYEVTFTGGVGAAGGLPPVSAAELNSMASNRKAAIVEILCRKNVGIARGVGALLVQHCISRVLRYTAQGGCVFTNLVRPDTHRGKPSTEDQYLAAPLMKHIGFRYIAGLKMDDGKGSVRTDEVDTNRWYALAGQGWQRAFASGLAKEVRKLIPICPVASTQAGKRPVFTRC